MKKKIIAISLVTMLCFNTFGYVFLYLQASYQFKKIATEKIDTFIPKDRLTKISVKREEKIDFINENEIEINGNMYDIVSKEETEDGMNLYCLSDENEDILNSTFYKFVSSNVNDFGKNTPKELRLKDGFDDFIKNINNVFFDNSNTEIFFKDRDQNTLQLTSEVHTPPPKTIV